MNILSSIKIRGLIGRCGKLQVFLAFAPANLLWNISFADILDEDTGEGYQRPHNIAHSRSFKKYITQPNASTIPLTFNLRKDLSKYWKIEEYKNGHAVLYINSNARCLAQVDCQHRLGELKDENIPFAFMTFIGLSLREEMALFNVINSKAKGLSSSLTDFHESNLLTDLSNVAPHLYIARKLNEDPKSPWFRLIRYGGETTSGLKRRTSLRMMQKAIFRFFKHTQESLTGTIDEKYQLILSFWNSVQNIFPTEWSDHRHNLLTKGVGLYALMYIFEDIVNSAPNQILAEHNFENVLMRLKGNISWDSQGMFAHAGGQKGAVEVYQSLKKVVKL
jgi:DNA sulfur modification protein DndB